MNTRQAQAPGFFGTRGKASDFSRLAAALKARRGFPEVPAPLVDNARRSAATLIASKRARAGAASFEHKLLERISLGWNLAELEQVEQMGTRDYIERQLEPEAIDDFGLEAALVEALPTIDMSAGELLLTYGDELETPVIEFLIATFYRSIFNPRQLYERMVIFWTDHFNIDLLSDEGVYLKSTDDREVIRPHALGKFPDLLRASAHSPAMLAYLTNNSNVKGHPNENYARELMELHTLGVDAGYTQNDVREVARCFTGWGLRGFDAGPLFGRFQFRRRDHDSDAKFVLGQVIPAGGGIEDGETVLDLLAAHPSTARFVSTKMLRYLWGYEPDERSIERIAQIYLDTGGDIKAMVRGILGWFQLATATAKLKRPYHLVASAVRALFADLEQPGYIFQSVLAAGHLPYNWAPPNGYPDSDGYWSGFILPRWNFAAELLTGAEGPSLRLELPFLDPSLPAAELVAILDQLLLNGTMKDTTRVALTGFYAAGDASLRRLGELIELALSAPEFQNY